MPQADESRPTGAIVDERVEREKFLDSVNAAFITLKRDPKAWQEELTERQLWDQTLADGLDE